MVDRSRLARVIFILAAFAFGAVALVACGGASQGGAETDAAREQFLQERAGTVTPGLQDDGMVSGAMPGVLGPIEKIEGRELTVKNPITGKTTRVKLTDSAKIVKDAQADRSALKTGEEVTAFYTGEGSSLKAEMVQIGGSSALMGGGPIRVERPVGAGTPPPMNGDMMQPLPIGTPPAPGEGVARDIQLGVPGQTTGSGMPQVVSGTVEKLEGDTLTIKGNDGKLTALSLGEQTRFLKETEVQLSELKAGTHVSATGTQNGTAFEATELRLIDGMVVRKGP